MKKKAALLLVLVLCISMLPVFGHKARAATTEIEPCSISSPGQVDDFKIGDKGVVYKKDKGDGETIYSMCLTWNITRQ